MAGLTDETLIKLLKDKREQINKKVDKAQQMQPAFDTKAVKYAILNVMEPLIKAIKKIQPEKIESVFTNVFDLLLYAISKYYYALPENQFTNIRLEMLFEKILPMFPEIIIEKPTNFIGKLFNAGEHLREKSSNFYRVLIDISDYIKSDNFTDYGQVAAWAVGETRLRKNALSILEKSPPGLILKLASLNNIPKSKEKNITTYIVEALKNDKWRSIEKPFSSKFIKLIQNNQEIQKNVIDEEISQPNLLKERPLVVLDDVGNFIGFKGNFSSPPNLIWGSNGTIIAYTEIGEIVFINIEGNGYREKSIRPRDVRVIGYNPSVGFIGINQKGQFVNLSNLKIYSEKITGTKKFFDYCYSISTSDYIYFILKDKEIYRLDSENVKKFVFKGNTDNLTVSTDDRFFFINIEKTETKKYNYNLSELSSTRKSKKIMKIKSNGLLRVNPPYVYILDEPNKLLIYDLKNNSLVKSQNLPLKITNCTSFLINEREIYITTKFSHHIICIGSNPYLS